ncbi:unnamed protein product [Notodromas monacha]|uniref:Uncharacterized protein n=1 Tax=Notodromas monacha TaxID=399045 RepID=A0A7R9GKA7_9CRUS|nr:unnamed protein product [Notodromas monacha]CAG0924552.1 unnamed protein product [Notodromas monacha]
MPDVFVTSSRQKRKAAAVCEKLAKSPVVNENASSSPDVSNDACRSLCTNTDTCSLQFLWDTQPPTPQRLFGSQAAENGGECARGRHLLYVQYKFRAPDLIFDDDDDDTDDYAFHLQRPAPCRCAILKGGVPYLGVSAGSNVAAVNICTTNDMPIIQPLKLEGIGLLPFNINVHFENRGDCAASRRNESRVDRLRDYLELYEGAPPIVCIRDGSALYVEGTTLGYVGVSCGKLFQRGEDEPMDLPVGTDLSFLLKNRTSHCTRMCLS